jgi:putative sigma-54 modulation protein
MNVSYTGIGQSLPERLQAKLDTKLQKLSKRVDRGAAREAHVVVSKQRHLLKAEVTMQFYGHPLVGAASDPDAFAAVSAAIDHLEKQTAKESARWRDKTRRGQAALLMKVAPESAAEPAPARKRAAKPKKSASSNGSGKLAGVVAGSNGRGTTAQRIFRVDHHEGGKPMTLDEALLEMEQDREYLVYRNAENDGVSVLVRRRDGHFDLIES